jgi:hypothetical protein
MASLAPISIIHKTTLNTEGRICCSRTGRSHCVLYPPNPRLITSTRLRYVCCKAGPNAGVAGSLHRCIRLEMTSVFVRSGFFFAFYLSPSRMICGYIIQ